MKQTTKRILTSIAEAIVLVVLSIAGKSNPQNKEEMMENFIDELLAELEAKEQELSFEYADLVLNEIGKLSSRITNNWKVAESEIKIIKDFYLSKNCNLQERINLLENKLNDFILRQEQRTIDLPNGTIRLRKGRERIIVEDVKRFLENKFSYELVNTKQDVKPDINKIKTFIQRAGFVPDGCKVVPANENEFSYKLREVNDESKT